MINHETSHATLIELFHVWLDSGVLATSSSRVVRSLSTLFSIIRILNIADRGGKLQHFPALVKVFSSPQYFA